MEIAIALILLVALAAFAGAPLMRNEADFEATESGEDPELADLEAAKEAKYRQIRDAELDREQGKLSPADWERLDAELRREAIGVLKRIDTVRQAPV